MLVSWWKDTWCIGSWVLYHQCLLGSPAVSSVVSNSLGPHRLQPTRLLCPWVSPGKDTGVGCRALLQGIFRTQGRESMSLVSPECPELQMVSLPAEPSGRPHSCVKQTASGKLLHSAGSSALHSVMTQRGERGIRERLQREGICTLTADSCFCMAETTQHCKAIMCVCVCDQSCLTLATPWIVARKAPLSMDSLGKNTGVGCHFLLCKAILF